MKIFGNYNGCDQSVSITAQVCELGSYQKVLNPRVPQTVKLWSF